MNKEEKIGYLANIYHLLISDGTVDRMEEDVFEQIRREIGAGYFEREGAMEMARKQEFQLRPVGRWSQRIRNLEDMIFAAYCNGVLECAEKKVIKDFASQLGINQTQFDVVKEETKRRYAQYKAKAR